MTRAHLPAVFFLLVAAAWVNAQAAYFHVPLRSLSIKAGALPDRYPSDYGGNAQLVMWPRVALDGGFEAYVIPTRTDGGWGMWPSLDELSISASAPAGTELRGRLFLPTADGPGMTSVEFTIPASAASDDAKPFLLAKADHYRRLGAREIPGAAWFRHQIREALIAAGGNAADEIRRPGRNRVGSDLDETYALFSGGRAVSENLQLDRVLPPPRQGIEGIDPATVQLDSIKGVTVREMNWAPLIKDAEPQLDPLAATIPTDQHAAFFPSMRSLVDVIAVAERHGVPALQSLQPQAESAGLRQRYERQLAHSLQDLLALSDEGLINGVAVTGHDPYLRVGTDLAIVMESPQPLDLVKRLTGRIDSATSKSADRATSATVELLDHNAVLLTNSHAQTKRFRDVRTGSTPELSAAPEYRFFRQRYPRGEADEAGFLILTDATIRRWCGPRMRIADSRRTRAAAVLADLQARHLREFVGQRTEEKLITGQTPHMNLGEVKLTPQGIHSSLYNTLAFMTPISEMQISEVTKAEAQAYERWRDGYQRNWSWAFDPIAFRLSLTNGGREIAGDVTVMPLIDSSRYREMIELSRGAAIRPGTGDPHEGTLAHVAFAVNRDSPQMKSWSHVLSAAVPQLKVNPLDWLGQTVALYVDDDPFWAQAAADADPQGFVNRNLGRLPIALHAEVRQPLKLAAFLTGIRAYIEQSAPNLTEWRSPQHNGRTYVQITANLGEMMGDDVTEFSLFYATSPDSFTLTLNEEVLKRAIDRQVARGTSTSRPAATRSSTTAPLTQAWLGSNLALSIDRRAIDLAQIAQPVQTKYFMQQLAWGNLPILNEWKRHFPDRDPLEVHEQAWHVRLVDPGGGEYVWNEQWQTMESTLYGHPGAPKTGPAAPQTVDAFQRGSFGVDFEPQGIRARARLIGPEPR